MNEAPCGYDHAPSGSMLLVRHGPSLKVDLDVLLGRTFLQSYVFTYDGPTGRAAIRKP
jgi:hypothetical protein